MSLEDLTPEERKQLNLGKLLLGNAEVKNAALRLAKKAKPDLDIPEIDLQDRLDAQRAEFERKLEERDQKDLNNRVAQRKRERDAEIITAGFKVEDIEAIIVREKCSYETAMRLATMESQLAEPAASDYAGGNSPGTPVEMRPGKDWSKLGNGDLRKKSAGIAAEMINEMRGRNKGRQPAR